MLHWPSRQCCTGTAPRPEIDFLRWPAQGCTALRRDIYFLRCLDLGCTAPRRKSDFLRCLLQGSTRTALRRNNDFPRCPVQGGTALRRDNNFQIFSHGGTAPRPRDSDFLNCPLQGCAGTARRRDSDFLRCPAQGGTLLTNRWNWKKQFKYTIRTRISGFEPMPFRIGNPHLVWGAV